ncbi:MAG: hypothetical protein HRT69_06720 [Flavobacteriaceae bacterium]|nr:hypothetical protein [Flavobacteriaceae bacterium]
MPIEIREIVIRTEVRNDLSNQNTALRKEDFQRLKIQLKMECKKMIFDFSKRKKR